MASPAKILIITNGPLARNPRVVKEATALGRAGYAVSVLTPRNHPPSEPHDAALAAGAPFRRVPLNFVPGFGTPTWRIFFRLLRHRLGRELMKRFGLVNRHALGPFSCILNAARAHPADLTIFHNEVAHQVGLDLAQHGRLVAADFEDWHSEDLLPEARLHRPIALIQANERALLHRAAYVSTTSEALADALFARYGGRHPLVLSNSFPLGPVTTPTPNQAPRILWFSQTIGPGRGLEEFVAAWGLTRLPSDLTLLGENRGGFATALRERLAPTHRARLHLAPLVSPDVLPASIAHHDIGLALEHTTPASRDLTITNKILQYLNAGLAVVATPTAGQREVFSRAPGAGILVDLAAPAATAAALDSLLGDRAKLASAQRAARAAAEQTYCWEREAPRLLAAVDAALHRPRP